jgi:hypothetical protein
LPEPNKIAKQTGNLISQKGNSLMLQTRFHKFYFRNRSKHRSAYRAAEFGKSGLDGNLKAYRIELTSSDLTILINDEKA